MLKPTIKTFLAFLACLFIGPSLRVYSQDADSLKAVLSRSSDPYVQAQLNLEIGGILFNRHDTSAVEFLRKAVMLSDQEKEQDIEMRSRYFLFLSLRDTRKLDEALKEVDRAITLAKILKSSEDQAMYTYQKARALRRAGRSEQSLEPYHDALNLYMGQQDSLRVSQCYNELGIAQKNMGQHDEARVLYHKSLVISRATKDSSRIANALNNLANVLKNLGYIDSALTYYYQALEMHEANLDTAMQTNVLNNIGIVLTRIAAYDMALKYYHDCLWLRFVSNDSLKYVSTLVNVAEVFEQIPQMDSAYYYTNRALELARIRRIPDIEALAEESLGDYLLAEGKIDQARAHYTMARQIRIHRDDKLELVSNMYKIGKVDLLQNRLVEADSTFKLVLTMSTEMGMLDIMANANRQLARVASAAGRFEDAFNYQVVYSILTDSLVSARQVEVVSNQMAKFEHEKKQREIELLNKENEVQGLRINREKTLRQSLIIGAILILILAFVLWNRARSLRTVNETLEYQKSVLQRNDHEKEVLLKEIHHRVKNNLQIISSLLSMHAREVKDEHVVAALTEGKNRVRSMALIHQMFYQDTEDLTEIGLHTYAKELCESILSSYSTDRNRINLRLDLDTVTINIDDGILLGLILNELVSNSVKYAFPGDRNGQISVSLKQIGDRLVIIVADDGVGKNDVHGPESTSFGLKLVNSFIRKLRGTMTVITENGYRTEISIPHKA